MKEEQKSTKNVVFHLQLSNTNTNRQNARCVKELNDLLGLGYKIQDVIETDAGKLLYLTLDFLA